MLLLSSPVFFVVGMGFEQGSMFKNVVQDTHPATAHRPTTNDTQSDDRTGLSFRLVSYPTASTCISTTRTGLRGMQVIRL